MHSIHTHQELLYNLAREGDPSAFYTLVAQFANAAYITERNSGKNHKEALMILIPFIKKAYQNFISTVHQVTFDVWYREFKRKYFHSVLDRPAHREAPDAEEISEIPMSDINHFGAIIEIVLQRQYGKIRRSKKDWFMLRLRRQFNQLHWLIKTAFIFAIIGVLTTAFICFLTMTKKQLTMIYSSKGLTHTIVVPFGGHSESNNKYSGLNNSGNNANIAVDSTITNPKKIHDTIRIHDTVKTLPPRINHLLPQKTINHTEIIKDNSNISPITESQTINKSTPSSSSVTGRSIYDSLK
jgi:hypothetical protein